MIKVSLKYVEHLTGTIGEVERQTYPDLLYLLEVLNTLNAYAHIYGRTYYISTADLGSLTN